VLDRRIEQQQQQQQLRTKQRREQERNGEGKREGADVRQMDPPPQPQDEREGGGGGGEAGVGAALVVAAAEYREEHSASVGEGDGGDDGSGAEPELGLAMAKSKSQPHNPRRASGGMGGSLGGGGGGSSSSSAGNRNPLRGSAEPGPEGPDAGGAGGGGALQFPTVVALQPVVGTPLAPKVLRILRALADLPAVLTTHRAVDRTRISCGGTGAVSFKTWNAFFHAAENLTRTLPDVDPPLPLVAEYAQRHCRHRGACDLSKMREVGGPGGPDSTDPAQTLALSQPPSCAIVGNGGRLRYEAHGEAIDAAEVVVRFNNGRTKGFEKQVGKHSHFRFYNGPSVEPKQAGELTVAQLRDPAVSHWAKQYLKHRDTFPEAYIMDPEIICHAWDLVDREGDKPSSGLVGIVWAMRLCRSVDVYGFQFDAYFNATMRPHYYDWERPKPGREHAHPFERERDLYLALAAAGLLTLH
jgi:hypothetical protein